MRSTRILRLVLILTISGLLILPHVYGTGKWTVLRNDDFMRNDGVEGHLQDVGFIDAMNGWAVGSQGLILQTTDGGKTWMQKTVEMERPVDFWNVYFKDESVGFITGVRGVILKTADGGQTWESKTAINEGSVGRDGNPAVLRRRLTDTWMVDEQIGYMVGENDTFIKTTDGGESWFGTGVRVAVGYSRTNYERIHFVSPTLGWIVGSFGTIMRTTDGGATWENQDAGVDNNLKGVDFVDENTGWISGQEGAILHTQDGGATWAKQKTDSYDSLYDIAFVDSQTGWAVGDFGTILHTTDGGQTWTREETGSSSPLYAIDALDKTRRWGVGEWGIIMGIGQ